MQRRVLVALVAALAVVGIGAAVFMNRPTESVGGVDPDDPAQVALGQEVYRQQCASCHGVGLEGQPDWRSRNADGRLPAPPHDETGHTWHHPEDQLFQMIKLGMNPPIVPEGYESDMPAYEGLLTDAEIWAVLSYIENTWPSNIRARRERARKAEN